MFREESNPAAKTQARAGEELRSISKRQANRLIVLWAKRGVTAEVQPLPPTTLPPLEHDVVRYGADLTPGTVSATTKSIGSSDDRPIYNINQFVFKKMR